MLNLEDIKSTISKRGGVASSNKFLLIIPFVNLNLNLNAAIFNKNIVPDIDFRDLGILCESVNFPGKQITTVDRFTGAYPIKIANGFVNTDINVTFTLTNDYYVKRVMDAWLDVIINSSNEIGYKEDYAKDLYIIKLNERGLPMYQMRVKSAYPVTIADIENNTSSRNEIQKLTVSFTYDDYDTYELDLKSMLTGGVENILTNGPSVKGLIQSGINTVKSLI